MGIGFSPPLLAEGPISDLNESDEGGLPDDILPGAVLNYLLVV